MRRQVPPDPVLPTGWAYNEIVGPDEISGKTIGLSLSGGGYRSTLFAVGAIAALADAQLWGQVRWVASVSGGSFANALAAAKLDSDPDRPAIDALLRASIERVTSRWSLVGRPKRANHPSASSRLGRSFQAGVEEHWPGPRDGAHLRLADLQREDRVHAFCAVDLPSLSPVFLTDYFIHSVVMVDDDEDFGDHIAVGPGQLALSTAVRASACFPVLPTVRVRPADVDNAGQFPMRNDLLLADGGLWNNLGSNWEETVALLARDRIEIPDAVEQTVDIHVVVDSSALAHRAPSKRTDPGRGSLDHRPLPLWRSFQATTRSALLAQRRTLWESRDPRTMLYVRIDATPSEVQALSALVGGASKSDWLEVVDFNKDLGTVGTTLRGMPVDAAVHLAAHGYAQLAAELTSRGIAFDRFQPPHPRIRSALVS